MKKKLRIVIFSLLIHQLWITSCQTKSTWENTGIGQKIVDKYNLSKCDLIENNTLDIKDKASKNLLVRIDYDNSNNNRIDSLYGFEFNIAYDIYVLLIPSQKVLFDNIIISNNTDQREKKK